MMVIRERDGGRVRRGLIDRGKKCIRQKVMR